jgi:Tfp pilus assembly protein PilO
MAGLKQTRNRFVVALIALAAISLAAIAVLLSPIGESSRHGRQRVDGLWSELRIKDRELVPLRGIDKKVLTAKEEITDFYGARLPSSYAAIFDQLGKLAVGSGVQLASGRYHAEPADVSGLQRIDIQANISGNYVNVVKFINTVERDKMFFLVDGVSLGEQQAGAVSLQIQIETYLRGESAATIPGQS